MSHEESFKPRSVWGSKMTDYAKVGGYGPESLPGHSGSETSEAGARHPGVGPKTLKVLEDVESTGHWGLTCRELEMMTRMGHGAASGALTRLHRAGYVKRLTEKRGKQQVYLHARFFNPKYGHEEAPYRPNAAYREDRKPMPLERLEPTLESIMEDLKEARSEKTGISFFMTEKYREMTAPAILKIVEKYR